MEIPELSELELKTLKLFTYYCASYGANSVYKTIYFSDCYQNWDDDNWHSNDIRSGSIESYDKIDELIGKLVNDQSLFDNFTTCEGEQRIEVDIDCKERVLKFSLYEMIYGEEPHSLSYNLDEIEEEFSEETYNEVVKLFESLNGSEGTVYFSGGGDSGYIDDFMTVDGNQVSLPASIEDMLYNMIESSFAGWENNDGAQGSWSFNPVNKEILFDFNYNTEEWHDVKGDYEIKF